MREIKFPESEPKRRLLAAAEGLFAEKGFESVSVRDVTQEAKANVAAVNYHFGSREGLIALVVSTYLVPVLEERLLRLDALEKKWPAKTVPVEELIDALVRPIAGLAKRSELSEEVFFKLFGRILTVRLEKLLPAVDRQGRELSERFNRSFGRALAGLSREELVWRLHFMEGSIVHLMLYREELFHVSGGLAGTPSMDSVIGRFIRFSAAGLREGLGEDSKVEIKKSPQAIFDF